MRTQIDISHEDHQGHTTLMCAALNGDTKTIKSLLMHGADANASDEEGRTALMFAAINLHQDAVKALLEHGAEVNARARDGCTALMLAASSGDAEIVQMLLDYGADINGSFILTGQTATTLAAERGHLAIIELLESVSIQNQIATNDEVRRAAA